MTSQKHPPQNISISIDIEYVICNVIGWTKTNFRAFLKIYKSADFVNKLRSVKFLIGFCCDVYAKSTEEAVIGTSSQSLCLK